MNLTQNMHAKVRLTGQNLLFNLLLCIYSYEVTLKMRDWNKGRGIPNSKEEGVIQVSDPTVSMESAFPERDSEVEAG